MATLAAALPWLVPGGAVALAVSILASGALGRWLGVRRVTACVILLNVGLILSGTLSPLASGAIVAPGDPRTCDLSRTWPASLSDLIQGNDVVVNLLMFLPLGCAIGLAPFSVRTLLVLLGAVALPFAIEAVQLQVSALGRACQSADIVDNLSGLAIGLVAGFVIAWLVPVVRRSFEPSS